MAKRFTDTEKWKRVWFMELSPVHKCLWSFILDNCSTGGIWEVNWKSAEFHIGAKLPLEAVREAFSKQFVELDGGKRWFIMDFVNFQYGALNQNNPAHKGAIKELQRYSLLDDELSISLPTNLLEAPSKHLPSPSEGTKDKGKDKGKGKEEAKDKIERVSEFVSMSTGEIGKLTEMLGEKRYRRAVEILDNYKGANGKRYKSDYRAILNWVVGRLEEEEAKKGKPVPKRASYCDKCGEEGHQGYKCPKVRYGDPNKAAEGIRSVIESLKLQGGEQ